MKKTTTIYFFIFLFFSFGIKAQEANNYSFSTNTSGSLTAGGGWTTIISTGENHTTFNDGLGNVPASAIVNIPFEVWFMGERFTSFNINTNGIFRFGSIPIFAEGNTYNINGHARLSPFGASSTTGGVLDDGDWQTGTIRYKVIGTIPNRTLIVQCRRMRISYNTGSNDATFEIHVYETAKVNTAVPTTSGQIEFVYGSMRNRGSEITSGNIGIGYSGAPGTNDFLSVNIANHTANTTETSNTYPSGTITQLHNSSNGNRRVYNFNPTNVNGQEVDVTATCLSSTSFNLSWTDNATNEVGIVLYRSIDGVNYTFDRQLPANSTSTIITGLVSSTTYYYQVYAVTEGKLSQLATTGTVTFNTLPPSFDLVYSVTDGVWNNILTWVTSLIPIFDKDVVIGCLDPDVVTVNAPLFPLTDNRCRTLRVEPNSELNFNTGETLRVLGDVTNSGTIDVNGGTLIIEGNLINNTGSTVNIGNGTLIVEGNFQNDNAATLNGNTGLFRLAGNFTNQGVYNSNTSIMRFDGTAQQFINHTGTSSGQGTNTVSNSYENDAALITPAIPATPATPIPIPDGDAIGISQTLIFPTTAQPITNVTLDLQIDHTWVGDLIVTLTSPDGTTRDLIDRIGTVGGFGCSGNDINVLLSDAAVSDVENECAGGTPTINGTFRPNESLAAFIGENPSGNWVITISDNVGADTGELISGSLNVTTTLGTTSVLVNPGTPATPAIPGLLIPDNDNTGINHTINVPTTGNIQNVRLDLQVDHTNIGDLRVTLTSPNGTTRRLMNRITNGTGSCTGDDFIITFDDIATSSIQNECGAGTPSINGSYQPEQTLSNFIGEDQQGNWILTISDRNNSNIGRIMSANLHIITGVVVPFPLSSNLYYHNLEMQNTGTGVRTQNTDVHLLNTATWTNGIFRADNNHILIFPNDATSTVAINASHADMSVRKIGDDAFNFPVGNAGWSAPIGISAPANTADHFTASYTRQVTPNDPFSKEVTIHHVGQCEYWILDRTNGASDVVVTLSYDDVRSCTVGPTTGLKVVRWDGSTWRDHFNGGLIATPYQGVVSSAPITNFSPFTLGASSQFNILPLTFLAFEAKPLESDAILDWTTTGEKNHDYFEVERSINGENFKTIGSVTNAISRDDTKNIYSFIDKNTGIENSEAYYRLKQIDTNGTFTYSDVQQVNWNTDNAQNQATFITYPNPFADALTLEFNIQNQENVEITLMDMTGRIIKTISQSFSKGNHKYKMNNLQRLSNGSYIIQMKTNTLQKIFKVVKM